MARNRQRAKDRKRKAKEQEPIQDSAFDGATAPGSPVPGVIPGKQGIPASEAIPELDDPQAGDAALLEAEEEAAAEHPETVPVEALEKPEPPARRGGPRFWQFLKACWAELERVQWPDRQQVRVLIDHQTAAQHADRPRQDRQFAATAGRKQTRKELPASWNVTIVHGEPKILAQAEMHDEVRPGFQCLH